MMKKILFSFFIVVSSFCFAGPNVYPGMSFQDFEATFNFIPFNLQTPFKSNVKVIQDSIVSGVGRDSLKQDLLLKFNYWCKANNQTVIQSDSKKLGNYYPGVQQRPSGVSCIDPSKKTLSSSIFFFNASIKPFFPSNARKELIFFVDGPTSFDMVLQFMAEDAKAVYAANQDTMQKYSKLITDARVLASVGDEMCLVPNKYKFAFAYNQHQFPNKGQSYLLTIIGRGKLTALDAESFDVLISSLTLQGDSEDGASFSGPIPRGLIVSVESPYAQMSNSAFGSRFGNLQLKVGERFRSTKSDWIICEQAN